MSTPLTLAFIAAVAGTGGYLATKKTVARGHVMAADLVEQLRDKGVSAMTCDDHIPFSPAGAVFECVVRGTDGSTATVKYTMDRTGSLAAELVGSTDPTEPASPRIPSSGDPWGD